MYFLLKFKVYSNSTLGSRWLTCIITNAIDEDDAIEKGYEYIQNTLEPDYEIIKDRTVCRPLTECNGIIVL